MKYDPQLHHRRSIRLKDYDYAQAGAYFITLCCQDKAHLFGEIQNGEMLLNEYGKIAHNEWLETPGIRKNVELDVFVIMPNHLHGILILTNRRGECNSPSSSIRNTSPDDFGLHTDENKGVCHTPLQSPSNTIGAIIRGYKSAVTKQLHALNTSCPVWQRNYYEHIIRNEQDYRHISEYILNNPAKWAEDRLYSR